MSFFQLIPHLQCCRPGNCCFIFLPQFGQALLLAPIRILLRRLFRKDILKVDLYLTIDCIEWRLIDAACKTKLIVRMPQIFFSLQESLKISHGPFAAF